MPPAARDSLRCPEKSDPCHRASAFVDPYLAHAPVFRHERLDVYRACLDFVALSHRVIRRFGRGKSELASQFEHAAMSIALNTAEGSGEFSPKEKSRFYRMAIRSCAECSTILDIAQQLEAVHPRDLAEGKALLQRIAAMLHAMNNQQGQRSS